MVALLLLLDDTESNVMYCISASLQQSAQHCRAGTRQQYIALENVATDNMFRLRNSNLFAPTT